MRNRDEETAAAFKALGDPTRLRIFQFLRACCCPVAVGEAGEVSPAQGPTAGEVCCHITGEEKITSSISFHLKELRQAGLITMERRGKHMICGVAPGALDRLAAFFGGGGAAVGGAGGEPGCRC
jgi:ArsR family transcriptional regulator